MFIWLVCSVRDIGIFKDNYSNVICYFYYFKYHPQHEGDIPLTNPQPIQRPPPHCSAHTQSFIFQNNAVGREKLKPGRKEERFIKEVRFPLKSQLSSLIYKVWWGFTFPDANWWQQLSVTVASHIFIIAEHCKYWGWVQHYRHLKTRA